MFRINAIIKWLEKAPPSVFSAYAILAAFSTYFCMYAFRKPFTAATFDGDVNLPFLPPMNYKILLIVAQVMGYCLSKFIGIKVISEVSAAKRTIAIVLAIAVAEVALLLFGIVPKPYNFIFLFINGIPLGMVWGLVFGFLEGRKVSEALGAGLSASYILASGVVKTFGKILIDNGISEFWMPALTGLIFTPIFLLAVWLLSHLPPPSAEDEALRTKRQPMNGKDRLLFFKNFTLGLISLIILHIILTAFRDFRDNFAREIWDAVGYSSMPTIMTFSEIPVAIGVLIALGLVMLIKNNRKALLVIQYVMLGGASLIGISTLLFQLHLINPAVWIILVGLGTYLAYVPFGCMLFDRLIAAVGTVGTAGFMIYLVDSFGYLGSVIVLLYKNFGKANLSWLDFFINFSYGTSIICSSLFAISIVYFAYKTKHLKEDEKIENNPEEKLNLTSKKEDDDLDAALTH